MRRLLLIALPLALLAPLLLHSDESPLHPPGIAENESGYNETRFTGEDGGRVMDVRWSLTRTEQDGRTIVTRSSTGTWYLGEGPIQWTEESVMELTSAGLRSLSWRKQSSGVEQETWAITYDWDSRRIDYSWSDALSERSRRETIELPGNVIPGDSLELVLRGFPFERGEGFRYRAQVVMADGSFLDGNVVHRGVERIETPFGEVECYKLELKPTGALGLVAPRMYYYFTVAEPHVFVLLDGREAGPFKPRTLNTLREFEPRAAIR